MNKLIEELAQEANILEHPLEGLGGYSGGNAKEVQKFAELIVIECVKVCEAAKPGVEQVPADIAINIVIKNLKDYFGVK